jgi:hypothetical protein
VGAEGKIPHRGPVNLLSDPTKSSVLSACLSEILTPDCILDRLNE